LGGIFVEVIKDVTYGLSPLSEKEALHMIRRPKGYKIIRGIRGKKPINEELLADILTRISALLKVAPEIREMDLNPLMGSHEAVLAVDSRIWVDKQTSVI
jgi:acetyltransferase